MKKVFNVRHLKACKICLVTYSSKRSDSIYCSSTCKGSAQLINNPKRKEQIKKWHQENTESLKKYARDYYTKNKGYYKAKAISRDAIVKQATPKWLSNEDKIKIVDIYSSCPSGWHVDHIMPLQGENSSGLHVPWNLQHLPALENIRKGNKV